MVEFTHSGADTAKAVPENEQIMYQSWIKSVFLLV